MQISKLPVTKTTLQPQYRYNGYQFTFMNYLTIHVHRVRDTGRCVTASKVTSLHVRTHTQSPHFVKNRYAGLADRPLFSTTYRIALQLVGIIECNKIISTVDL